MYDTIFIGKFLRAKGFKEVDYGWGNWQNGPRFTYAKFIKDSCKCEVDRVYFDYKKMEDGYYNLKIKEGIICNEEPLEWFGDW
jgi:hypothetical protein